MVISFYEMSVRLLGSLPDTMLWLYDLTTFLLVCSAFLVFIIPISLIFKRVIGG